MSTGEFIDDFWVELQDTMPASGVFGFWDKTGNSLSPADASDTLSAANLSGTNTGDVTVTDTAEIDMTLTGQDIKADIVASSIDETKLDASVNASLDLADSSVQAPAGSAGDIQLNISGSFGVLDGVNLDTTGNARGTNSLDIQSSRSAVTQVASGDASVIYGFDNTASADYSVAMGSNLTVSGGNKNVSLGANNTTSSFSAWYTESKSVTIGHTNTASNGIENVAIGWGNTSSGDYYGLGAGSAIGYGNFVGDWKAVAIGYVNSSTEQGAVAIGAENFVSGERGVAIGRSMSISQDNGLGIGDSNLVTGEGSISVGKSCRSDAFTSVSMGSDCRTYGIESVSVGLQTYVDGREAVAFGFNSRAGGLNSLAVGSFVLTGQDYNSIIGNSTSYININNTGISYNHSNALAGGHFDSVLATDTTNLGSEKVTNGTFTGSATGWTVGTGWTYFSNFVRKTIDGTGTLSQNVSAVAGEYYLLSFLMRTHSAGTLDISLGGSAIETINQTNTSGNKTYSYVIKAVSTGNLIFTPSNDSRFQAIDNVSVKKIMGGDVLAPVGNICAGTDTPLAQLHTTEGRIRGTTRVTTTYTILTTDDTIFANTDSAGFTATLPAGVEGQTFKIINSGSSSNQLTIAPDGSEDLLGANSNFTLNDGESLLITFNATDGWY